MPLNVYIKNDIFRRMQPQQLFNLLAHPLRLRAVMLLADGGEYCVCEFTEVLQTVQPVVSRHLGQMRAAGLLQDRRQGQWVFYSLRTDLPAWVRGVIGQTAEGLGRCSPYSEDRQLLAGLEMGPQSNACT